MRADRKEGRDIIYLDIKKSFHTVLHKKGVYDASKYVIDGEMFNWIKISLVTKIRV